MAALLSTAAALLTTTPAAAQQFFPSDSVIRAEIGPQLQAGERVGIVIGLIEADGTRRVVSVGHTGPIHDAHTLFEIGSVTKAFTGILLAEMVERGVVRFDTPVAALLPPGTPVPERAGRQITLLDLATQSSGLPRLPDNLRPATMANPYADYSVAQLYEFLAGYELPRDIGALYEYSNLGMGLLGLALGLRADASYEALVRARILEPLGMESTAIVLDAEARQRLAPGHNALGQVVPNWDLPTLAGAGALRSSVDDMLAFVAANLDPPDSPLGRAMRASHEARVATANPNLRVGLAWHLLTVNGHTFIWHNGGTGGYRSFIGFDPVRNVGVVVLSNGLRSMDEVGLHLLDPTVPLPAR
jgi:serine-type D-Ala-D-Ala carboxypeptidase/endopeptidase